MYSEWKKANEAFIDFFFFLKLYYFYQIYAGRKRTKNNFIHMHIDQRRIRRKREDNIKEQRKYVT
jgi:amino acid permease